MITSVEKAYFEQLSRDNVGLAASFAVNPSSCENPAFYGEYLRFSALQDYLTGQNTTHLFIDDAAQK